MTPLAIPASAQWKGGRDAKVVIQVFSEFQCPFCKRAEVPMPGQDGTIDPNGAGMLAATTLGLLLVPVFYVVIRRLLGDKDHHVEPNS